MHLVFLLNAYTIKYVTTPSVAYCNSNVFIPFTGELSWSLFRRMLGLGDALGLVCVDSSYPGSTTNLTGCTVVCRYCEYAPEKKIQCVIVCVYKRI